MKCCNVSKYPYVHITWQSFGGTQTWTQCGYSLTIWAFSCKQLYRACDTNAHMNWSKYCKADKSKHLIFTTMHKHYPGLPVKLMSKWCWCLPRNYHIWNDLKTFNCHVSFTFGKGTARWSPGHKLVTQFREENYKLFQFNTTPVLTLTLEAGLAAMKTPYPFLIVTRYCTVRGYFRGGFIFAPKFRE